MNGSHQLQGRPSVQGALRLREDSVAIRGIFWDFGGVIADSPFNNLSQLEKQLGLPADFLRRTNAVNPDTNAWARFERGEIDLASFDTLFQQETAARGHAVPGASLIPLLQVPVRARMAALISRLAGRYIQGCLTNNLPVGEGAAMSQDPDHARQCQAVLAQFDFVVESCREGCRKPENAFYLRALERAGLEAEEVVFLDDLGINLKPARALGMTTIKVTSEAQAIADLSGALGIALP